jgi:hypothetical protein
MRKIELKMYQKIDIAREMLETALKLYFEGKDYFSVIQLAGASEEIFGKYLKEKGIINSLESDVEGFILINKKLLHRDVTKEEARHFFNKIKNSIKHMYGENDKTVSLDPLESARSMLGRAVMNWWWLEQDASPLMEKFWDSIKA